MTILVPNWMQGGTYPARIDRQLIQRTFGGREMVFDGLVATQTGSPSVAVQISAGSCVIQGDDQTDQGMYLVVMDAAATVAMPAVPGTNKRIDLVGLRINDPNAGGNTGSNATWVITQGTASATPVAPATPASTLVIAQVLRTSTDGSVLNAQITDVVGRGLWPYTIATAAVPAKLPPNYLYVRVA